MPRKDALWNLGSGNGRYEWARPYCSPFARKRWRYLHPSGTRQYVAVVMGKGTRTIRVEKWPRSIELRLPNGASACLYYELRDYDKQREKSYSIAQAKMWANRLG